MYIIYSIFCSLECTKLQLGDLCTLLAPIAPKYCAIGTVLRVPMDKLGLVYSPETHQDNLRRTLEWWLNNGDKPTINSPVTWDNIISVVEGSVIQNYTVAQNIRKCNVFTIAQFIINFCFIDCQTGNLPSN